MRAENHGHVVCLTKGSRVRATFTTSDGVAVSARVATIWWGLVSNGDLQHDASACSAKSGPAVFRTWDQASKLQQTLSLYHGPVTSNSICKDSKFAATIFTSLDSVFECFRCHTNTNY